MRELALMAQRSRMPGIFILVGTNFALRPKVRAYVDLFVRARCPLDVRIRRSLHKRLWRPPSRLEFFKEKMLPEPWANHAAHDDAYRPDLDLICQGAMMFDFEDNDGLASPHELGAGNHQGLMICSGDDDYYGVSVGGGLSASISFDHGAGDLDLELYRDGSSLDTSTSTSDSESVSGDGGGTYVVRVYGYQGAQGSYSLNLTAY